MLLKHTLVCTCDHLKKVIITESTREVLFLQTDWCSQLHMATTAPLSLPQQRSRRLRGQKPLSPSRRQVEEEWSGVSPTPPPPSHSLLTSYWVMSDDIHDNKRKRPEAKKKNYVVCSLHVLYKCGMNFICLLCILFHKLMV